jgi:serine/threonine-protein kinase RsbW
MDWHLQVEARIENLGALLALIDTVCRERGVSREIAFQTRLAVDEMCTNVIVHGYRGLPPGPIALTVTPHPDRLVIRIVDRGHPFDPRSAPAPDLGARVEERPIGGLGCHLVRSMVDSIDYESAAHGGNRLTLVKLTDGKG